MSWGERSCKKFGNCGISGTGSCDTNCILYIWDGKKIPDSPKVKFSVGNHMTVWGHKTRDGYRTLNGLPIN